MDAGLQRMRSCSRLPTPCVTACFRHRCRAGSRCMVGGAGMTALCMLPSLSAATRRRSTSRLTHALPVRGGAPFGPTQTLEVHAWQEERQAATPLHLQCSHFPELQSLTATGFATYTFTGAASALRTLRLAYTGDDELVIPQLPHADQCVGAVNRGRAGGWGRAGDLDRLRPGEAHAWCSSDAHICCAAVGSNFSDCASCHETQTGQGGTALQRRPGLVAGWHAGSFPPPSLPSSRSHDCRRGGR